MANGTTLSGVWTLKMADKNVANYQVYTLNFAPNNVVDCPGLGSLGRYYCEGDYLLMGFSNPGESFNFPTDLMFFGKITPYGDCEGVVGSLKDNAVGGWVAASGNHEPVVSSNFGVVNNLNGQTFYGIENPNDVSAMYRFNIADSIGIVNYGTPNGGATLEAKYQTLRYNSGSEQLLVFANDRMVVYGAVVEEVGGEIRLKDGMYMNPFSGPGYYNTWHAQN